MLVSRSLRSALGRSVRGNQYRLRNGIPSPTDRKLLNSLLISRRYHGLPPGVDGATVRANFSQSQAIMRICIASCLGVFAAWNWSRGRFQDILPPSLTGTPGQRNKVQRFLFDNFTIKSTDIKEGRAWTLFTSAFSHIELYHLVGNLFGFHAWSRILIFAGIAPLRYAGLVIGSALSGNLGFLLQDTQKLQNYPERSGSQSQSPSSLRTTSPSQQTPPLRTGLGLSGVVMGIGAAAAFTAPRAQMLIMGIVPMPVWALMGLYLVWDSYLLDSPTSRVGHAAHLGGAGFGALFYLLALRGKGGLPLRALVSSR